jgi:hypothetical protein
MLPSPLRRLGVLLILAAGCSSPAGNGNGLIPGVTNGGTGGAINLGGTGGISVGGAGGGSGAGGLVLGQPDAAQPSPDGPLSDAGGGAGDAGGTGGIAAVGDKCTTGGTCPPGGVCAADVAGGGYCTADCTKSGICPAGATCAPASDTLKICLKTCAQPSHCRAEHVCLSGVCVPRCTQDSDCDSGSCDVASGLCGGSKVGAGCTKDTDCGAAPAFCDTGLPGGYCSRPCGGPMNVTCPDTANCISGGGSGACLKACATSTDCRTGFLCSDLGGAKSCVPRCTLNSDCAVGYRCEAGTGACVAGPPPGTAGGPCTGDADCTALGGGAFCALASGGFPGGYCSAACENAACVSPGVCVPASATESNCLAPCTVPADCRADYTCFAFQAAGVCLPRCTSDAECMDPRPVCDLATGYCAARPTGGMGMTSDTINLTPNGPVSLDGVTLSDRLVVTIPADAVSVTFVGQAVSDPTATIALSRLEQSSDDFATSTRLFELGSINNVVRVPSPTAAGVFSALYPNSPTAPFTASTTTSTVKVGIRLDASSPTTVNVIALLKRASSPVVTQGQIDVNLFFVGVPGLDAGSAPTDARFQQVFGQVKSTWSQVGISVGTVNYIDLGAADAAQFSDLDVNDLGTLMTRSKNPAAKDGAMNVFFVHTINGDILAGYIILGISAGLPGAPIRGTAASGLAVTMADFPQGLGQIAETWAHEGGHNLGLFHTTESSGTAFDPLPDTPECNRAQHDANANRVLEASECQGFGADNLMFWTTSASALNVKLTPHQGFVLLRDPVVH